MRIARVSTADQNPDLQEDALQKAGCEKRQRTQAGLRAARTRGRNGGRPANMDSRKISMARALMENPNASITDVCYTLRVSRATLYRHLERAAGK
jgi:DNA invertase Pin-like site-specific DNA recombinase